jgi:hypothetical protein
LAYTYHALLLLQVRILLQRLPLVQFLLVLLLAAVKSESKGRCAGNKNITLKRSYTVAP